MGMDLSPSKLATAKSSQIDAQTTHSEFCSALDLASLVIARGRSKLLQPFTTSPQNHTNRTLPSLQKVVFVKIMSALWPWGQICHQLALAKIHFYLHRFEVIKFHLTSETITTNFQPFQFCVSPSPFCCLVVTGWGVTPLDQSCAFLKWGHFTHALFFTSLILQGIICLPNKGNVFMIASSTQSLLQTMNSSIHLINIHCISAVFRH